uniref:site-specific integrase n=1 Tax=Pedobacter schmidteae TaxID=2201271 RepID=UPI000EB35EFE|nr:site-specific integrase [Pedobacter schmidteae]
MKVNEKLFLTLYLKKIKGRNNQCREERAIMLRIHIAGPPAEISVCNILPKNWNAYGKCAKGNSTDAVRINNAIKRTLTSVENHYEKLTKGSTAITAKLLKLAYDGKLDKKRECETFLQALDFKITRFEAFVKVGKRAKTTLNKWKATRNKVVEFLKWNKKIPDILLDDMSYAFAEDLLDFLMIEGNLQQNSAMKYLKNCKEVLKMAVQRKWLIVNPLLSFKCPYLPTTRVILNPKELYDLINTQMRVQRLEEVRDAFVFQCFTGYAFKDIYSLTPENIKLHFDGEEWLVKDRHKSLNGVVCAENVPLLPIVKEIIEKYKNHPCRLRHNRLLPVNALSNYNGYLKEIAAICGIEKKLTTHVARHTFATTVLLCNGVPIETVMVLLGHKNIRSTQIYAKITAMKISEDWSIFLNAIMNRTKNIIPISYIQSRPVAV